MSGRILRAPAALAPAAGTARPIVVKLGGSVVRSGELRHGSMRSPARASPSWSCREAARWPTRCAPASRGSASAMRPRTAWRCSPWISWPGPWLVCGRVSPWAPPKPSCAMRSSAAAWRSGRLMPDRRTRRYRELLAAHLRQPRALARRADRRRALLSDQVDRAPQGARLSARQLARDGVVDEAFADMLAETGTPTILLGRGDHDSFVASAAEGHSCGAEIA